MPYRVNRKKFFLTYSQCGTLTMEEVLTHMGTVREVSKYLIAQELHEDGNRHIHCFVEFKTNLNSTNARWADVQDHHPNDGGTVKNHFAVVKYCSKDGDYITNFYEQDAYAIALGMETKEEAIEHIKSKRPREWVNNSDRIESSLAKHFKVTHVPPKYKLEDFIREPLDLSKANLVYGKSGSGKTQYCLAHFKNPLTVSTKDDLRKLDPSIHDGVVFDDMDFSHYPTESIIHLLDIEQDRSLYARYSDPIIPRGFPRIISSNKPDVFATNKITEEQKVAITRRINIINITADIRKNPISPPPTEIAQELFGFVDERFVDRSYDY